MKDYIDFIINEQIEKSRVLSSMIPGSITPSILQTLGANCKDILNSNINKLEMLLDDLRNSTIDYNDYFLREISNYYKINSLIEAFGISALFYYTTDLKYINNILIQISIEINSPVDPPSVACISMDYYFYFHLFNVIYVPVSEAKFLLHIVNLFHEYAHCLLYLSEYDSRLFEIYRAKEKIIKKVTLHYNTILNEIKRQRQKTPKKLIELIEGFHNKWKSFWVEEIISDIFSMLTVGPGFAYGFFHLVIKELSKDIYQPGDKHPPDYIRFYFILFSLQKLGYTKQKEFLSKKISKFKDLMKFEPDINFQFLFNEELFEKIFDIILKALEKIGFNILYEVELKKKQDGIIFTLNNAWNLFWEENDKFLIWEKDTIQELKNEYS